jgi:F0F1-type ATP synthase beta subunit
MDQFNSVNSDSYKKKNIAQEFFHSCLGKIVIFLGVLLVLYIFAIITVPTKKMMLEEAFDNIQECLQDNDSIKADEIDEFINNISRTISVADTTKTNKEVLNTFLKYNTLIVYSHLGFKTVHIVNGIYPQGERIGIGIFQTVISTVNYNDLVVTTGAVRGDYNKQLNAPVEVPDSLYTGENPNVQPYHYQGDTEN